MITLQTFEGSTPFAASVFSNSSKLVSKVQNPSGKGTWTKPGSMLPIQSFSAGMPPACCEPSVRP